MDRVTRSFSFLAAATSLVEAKPSSCIRSRTRLRRWRLAFLLVGLKRSGAAMVAAREAAWERLTNLIEVLAK